MVRRIVVLSTISLVILSSTASAGLIFNRRGKQQDNAKDQPQDPISVLRHDTDEHHRLSAVQSLGRTDLKQNPQAAFVLIDVLLKDASPNVRAAAADVLGKLHPMAVQIGMALEQASSSDSSPSVRNVASASLAAYVHAGYQLSAEGAPPLAPSGAPPTAPAGSSASKSRQSPNYKPVSRPKLPSQTDEPPTAKPVPTFVVPPLSGGAEPVVPNAPMLVPTPPPASDHDLLIPTPPAKVPTIEMSPEPAKPPVVPAPNTDKPKDSKDSKPAGKSENGPILNGPG